MKMRELPVPDRPRERLVYGGVTQLSNEELLMILLKTGTKKQSVKTISLLLLKESGGLKNLSLYHYEQLKKIPGIGMAKACELLAAVEIGKRIHQEIEVIQTEKITSANIVFNYYKDRFKNQYQECFCCLYLDESKKVIQARQLFLGTLNQSVVHPREIFKEAYLLSASSLICVHNHPSNNITPSKDDIELTRKLVSVGILLGVPVLDHVIIGRNQYYSFLEQDEI